MSISSYAELSAAIGEKWSHRTDLTSVLPDLIMLAEKRINRDVRCPDMETDYTGAIASGVIAVPTDFLEWKVVYVNGADIKTLQPKTLEWLYTNYPTRSADSEPRYIARNGSNFEFGPYPDSNYTIKGTYYKKMASVATAWHALATTNPDLYLMAGLCEAALYTHDDSRLQLWESRYQSIVGSLNEEGQVSQTSGAPLRVTAR